ncbi:MAG: ribonuclease III [Christensenellaceae bacterium]|jgi:ribonuclease-3|nr:ribonuclease III [Christensenellaceae bacterium]
MNSKSSDRSKSTEKNAGISEIEKKIGYKFKNLDILLTALTHTALANETGKQSYDRLEFLGDSLLNFITAKHLYQIYADKNEGFMTKTRARVVSTKTLSIVIDKLELIKYLQTGNAARESILSSQKVKANLFESIAGAIYLDGGLAECEKYVLTNLRDYFIDDDIDDYKSLLLEHCAKNSLKIVYNNTEMNSMHTSQVIINEHLYATATSTSKSLADQIASKITVVGLGLLTK